MPETASPILQEVLDAVRHAYNNELGTCTTDEDALLQFCLAEIRETFVAKRTRPEALEAAQVVLQSARDDLSIMIDALDLREPR